MFLSVISRHLSRRSSTIIRSPFIPRSSSSILLPNSSLSSLSPSSSLLLSSNTSRSLSTTSPTFPPSTPNSITAQTQNLSSPSSSNSSSDLSLAHANAVALNNLLLSTKCPPLTPLSTITSNTNTLLTLISQTYLNFTPVNYATAYACLTSSSHMDTYTSIKSDKRFQDFFNYTIEHVNSEDNVEYWRSEGPRVLCSILHTTAKLQIHPKSAMVLMEGVNRLHGPYIASKANPQSTANTAWAFAIYKFRPTEYFSIVDGEDNCVKLVMNGTPQTIVNTLLSMTKLNVPVPNYLALLSSQGRWIVLNGDAMSLSNGAWSLSSQDYLSPGYFKALNVQAKWLVDNGRVINVTSCLAAYAKLQVLPVDYINVIHANEAWIIRNGERPCVTTAIWSLGVLGVLNDSSKHMVDMACAQISWLKESSQLDIISFMYGVVALDQLNDRNYEGLKVLAEEVVRMHYGGGGGKKGRVGYPKISLVQIRWIQVACKVAGRPDLFFGENENEEGKDGGDGKMSSKDKGKDGEFFKLINRSHEQISQTAVSYGREIGECFLPPRNTTNSSNSSSIEQSVAINSSPWDIKTAVRGDRFLSNVNNNTTQKNYKKGRKNKNLAVKSFWTVSVLIPANKIAVIVTEGEDYVEVYDSSRGTGDGSDRSFSSNDNDDGSVSEESITPLTQTQIDEHAMIKDNRIYELNGKTKMKIRLLKSLGWLNVHVVLGDVWEAVDVDSRREWLGGWVGVDLVGDGKDVRDKGKDKGKKSREEEEESVDDGSVVVVDVEDVFEEVEVKVEEKEGA